MITEVIPWTTRNTMSLSQMILKYEESPFGGSFCVQRGGTVIEIDPQTCAVSSFVYRAIERLFGEDVAERFWYDGDTNYGLYQRSFNSTFKARLESDNDRHRIDGASAGQRCAEGHPAPAAETVPP